MANNNEHHLGGILVEGHDAVNFLQGQLSNDVTKLEAGRGQLNSLSNAKGRVLAVLIVIALDADQILLVLPKPLEDDIKNHLQRFVFRSKVKLSVFTDPVNVVSLKPDSLSTDVYSVTPSVGLGLGGNSPEAGQITWIEAGLPWIYPATQGQFVAQMLNLDLLQGISWDKGCYTGQEIIARTHYRGKNKRRMLAFASAAPAVPGSLIVDHQDRQVAIVVDCVPSHDTEDGYRVLAVARLADLKTDLRLADGSEVSKVDLPYGIPELTEGLNE